MAKLIRFNYKKLDVYQAALEHFAWTVQVMTRLPSAPFAFRSQVLSAALSTPANIAEANGRNTRSGEAEQHYRYAQGSTYESAAFLDALHAMNAIDDAEYNLREDNLARIASMLDRLARKHATRRQTSIARPRPSPRPHDTRDS